MFSDIEQPGLGTVRAAGSPLTFAALERPPTAPAPLLGQHTDELAELAGIDAQHMAKLKTAGALR